MTKPPSKPLSKTPSGAIPERLRESVVLRLRENKRVRRTLPAWGRIHVDRQVPFICVYRRQSEYELLDLHNLVTSEAAYLYADSAKQIQEGR